MKVKGFVVFHSLLVGGVFSLLLYNLGVSLLADRDSVLQTFREKAVLSRATQVTGTVVAVGTAAAIAFLLKPSKKRAKWRPMKLENPAGFKYGELQGMFHAYGEELRDTKIVFDINPDRVTENEMRIVNVIRHVCCNLGNMEEVQLKDALKIPPVKTMLGSMAISLYFNYHEIKRRLQGRGKYGFKLPVWFPVWPKLQHQTTLVSVGRGVRDPTEYLDNALRYNITVKIYEVRTDDERTRLNDDDDKEQQKFGLYLKGTFFTMYHIMIDPEAMFRWYNVHGCSMMYPISVLEKSVRLQEDMLFQLQSRPNPPRRYQFEYKYIQPKDVTEEHRQGFRSLQETSKVVIDLLRLKEDVDYIPSADNMSRLLGVLFLDNRNGLSYGFLASQLAMRIPPLVEIGLHESKPAGKEGVTFRMSGRQYFFELPPIRMMCSRSGCDKTNLRFEQDVIILERSPNTELAVFTFTDKTKHIMPSFDTWVILGQAVGNLLLASVFRHVGRNERFCQHVERGEMLISHFHGFIKRELVPPEVYYYGHDDPPLPCGCVKSPEIALREKISIAEAFMEDKHHKLPEFIADLHLEKDHGTMISGPKEVIEMLTSPKYCKYGNVYFRDYEDLTY